MSDIALPAIASPRVRWLRRYGLAVVGAAIILAWILAAIFVLVNFLVDMSYALLDPRVVKK